MEGYLYLTPPCLFCFVLFCIVWSIPTQRGVNGNSEGEGMSPRIKIVKGKSGVKLGVQTKNPPWEGYR